MARVSKTLADGQFRYINVLDIKSEDEHERLYQQIKKIVETNND